MKRYQAPILTTVYNWVGILVLGASAITFLLALSKDATGTGLSALAAGLVAALLCFGIAQVVGYIGETAHNTRDIAVLLRAALQLPEAEPLSPAVPSPPIPFTRSEPSLKRTIRPSGSVVAPV